LNNFFWVKVTPYLILLEKCSRENFRKDEEWFLLEIFSEKVPPFRKYNETLNFRMFSLHHKRPEPQKSIPLLRLFHYTNSSQDKRESILQDTASAGQVGRASRRNCGESFGNYFGDLAMKGCSFSHISAVVTIFMKIKRK